MICIVAKLKAKSGEEAKMEKALRDVLPKVQQEEGTLLYKLHRAQDDPTLFMVYEEYKDMDAFMFHSTTPYLAELFETILPIMDGDPVIEMYDELD